MSAYPESAALRTMLAAASAAAVSAATSVPGLLGSILYDFLTNFTSSGLSQVLWSKSGSPT